MVPSFHADRLVSQLFYHTITSPLNLSLFSECLTKVNIDLAADEYDRRVAASPDYSTPHHPSENRPPRALF